MCKYTKFRHDFSRVLNSYDIFYEVHKICRESVLVLIGEGLLLSEIKEKVKNLGLNDCVLFLGNKNDVYKFYQVFDVFVLPSRYEGLPVVAVEAQINGLPCLLSDKMTKETAFSPSAKFLKSENNVDEWAAEIINTDIAKGRECVDSYLFDIEIQAKKLEEQYGKFVAV